MLAALFCLFQATPAPAPAQATPPQIDRRLDLSVERCVELALQNNPDLAALAFSAEASTGTANAAEGDFDPIFGASYNIGRAKRASADTFNVSGSQTSTTASQSLDLSFKQKLFTGANYELSLNNRRLDISPAGATTVNPSIGSTLALSVTQPLLRGAWSDYARSAVTLAEMDKAKAEKSFDEKVMATIQAVHNAYWDLVFAIEDVEVKRFSLSLGEKLLDINQKKVKEGVSAPVEVLQAETEIAVRREALITAENTRQAAEDSLKQLVFPFREQSEWNFQIGPNSPVPAVGNDEIPETGRALETALALRPELLRQRVELKARDLAVEVAQSDTMPKLDLGASRSNSGVQRLYPDVVDDLKGDDFPGYTISLTFELPIGNQGPKGRLKAAEAERAAAQQTLRALENLIAREVRDAIRNLQFQREKLAATQKSRELAQKQLEAEERKFEVGLSTNFQVLQFQQDLVQAITNEKSALLNHAKALIGLKKSQGILRP